MKILQFKLPKIKTKETKDMKIESSFEAMYNTNEKLSINEAYDLDVLLAQAPLFNTMD